MQTTLARRGISVAPHALAAQSATAVLREGGNALEAMVAAAATISVVYPHMNGIGGDAFWVVSPAEGAPFAIDASGPAAQLATIEFYGARALPQIPPRGAVAANTVAGTVGGWALALEESRSAWGGRLPLARLLEDAIDYAEAGVPVTASQEAATRAITFRTVGDLYLAAHASGWRNPKHRQQWRNTLSTYASPVIGRLPVADIDTDLVMRVLEPIWTNKPETAGRVRGRIESILDWAATRGHRTGENPARWRGHLDQLLPKRQRLSRGHHTALAYGAMSDFMASRPWEESSLKSSRL